MQDRTRAPERSAVREEPVLFVGRAPGEHGVLREITCGAPRPVMCRLCQGERDCPYVAARSPLRVRVTYREPTDPVPPLEHRAVATGSEGLPAQGRHRYALMAASTAGWAVAVGLVVWFWVLHRPSAQEVAAVLGLKAAVFAFVVIGVPLVRLGWSHHGGRFRKAS